MKPVYKDELITLYHGNSLEVLKKFEENSVDVVITDPPFFLSNGGVSCKNGRMVSVDKGEWDKLDSMTIEEFYTEILVQLKRILKFDGSIWIFGTMHNVYVLGYLMNKLEFKIMNNITWQKTNPAPNLGCRMFTHSTETILWAKQNKKSKHIFNYHLMKKINGNKQMKDVWTTTTIKKSEKKYGNHPTQKPIDIIERMILASTNEDSIILDPFIGSGTTLLAAKMLNRKSIGIDVEKEYINLANKRIKGLKTSEE
ncbi:DNA-methyltransferase [Enterococcus faecalis]|uniref:DNA-methyltransferase n=1 Tax=Enterococcus faecalis TaxID=1351 RepID=UPI000CF0B753|nr:site-specific DNA-methyltransferase [Enterococcus faecalis]BDH64568.1 methyltransferase [Enterococcus sp. PLM3]EGO2671604.1 site-specific DNA-methyltransferase [Enterococcus faecalis]EGO2680081.1 site-specific DNA-methyltransferase [Enterococcus faecalis]EGO2798651.1 site-specific DNA-methyltransferase [Enterococcus faecalis]EGO2829001.1 site-specific DNA-methyltransferase [Enterococcus faecalis]